MANKPNDDSSLSHTRWNCKYHIVFMPKYRRKEIYGKLKSDIGKDIKNVVQIQESRNNRSTCNEGPYSYACNDTAKVISIKFYGIFKR